MTPLTPLGWFFTSRTRRFVYESADAVPARSVVIVPGARVLDGEPSLVLADRLSGALDLLRSGTVDRALISGGPGEIPVMRRWLRDRGISPEKIESDPGGLRTLLTMERAKALFGIEDAVIATNRFHLTRAIFLARALGIDAVGLVVDRQVYGKRHRDEAREVIAQGRALVDLGLRRFQG